ncbi:TPA: hypothetical protein OUI21_006034 [Pseudomonas aeruginosa]|nr:hypothetical protein [Pseudomonas aeruginosa]
MNKSITIAGIDYVFYVWTGELFRVRPSGRHAAGYIRSLVKSGSREFKRVFAAIEAA